MKSAILGALVGAAVLAVPGMANANQSDVFVNCNGITVTVGTAEIQTTITIRNRSIPNGVRSVGPSTVDKAPLSLTVASPNPSQPQTWSVLVDSPWHDDERPVIYMVPGCPAPTTTTTVPPSTTVPAPTTTVSTETTVPPTTPTTTVAVDIPPIPTTPSTVVVTTPRPIPSTPSSVPGTVPVLTLPETGADQDRVNMPAYTGMALVAVGLFLLFVTRRQGR